MAAKVLYPLGLQYFEEIRSKGCLYVDKTEYIYKMAHSTAKYFFLSRPRRFGKSLLVYTMKSYFEGRRDLFKGLAIDRLETEWTEYPVLRFSMASGKHKGKEELELYLNYQLADHERAFNMPDVRKGANNRLGDLIRYVYQKTGKQVVVLIDEYDAPLLDVVHEETELPVLRHVMRNFYSPLKDCDPYLRFVFLTGITKFSQLSIFSELNNITNISMEPEYAAICGITKEELVTQFTQGIDELAAKKKLTHDEMVDVLTKMYDGYHFTWPSPDIFNPFSIISVFFNMNVSSYWFGSGTPTYLIEMMKKFGVSPSEFGASATREDFDAPTERMTSMVPLLYQSGYITIKDYDEMFDSYTLDIPNKEVRIGLMRSLIPHYIMGNTAVVSTAAVNIARALYKDDMDGALQVLQAFLASVPYCDNTHYEGHWQQVLYIIFSLLGSYCDVEVHTATGRIDMVMVSPVRLYLIEVKLDGNAPAALAQINMKDYAARFALYTLPVTKVGINFDSERHTIGEWMIE